MVTVSAMIVAPTSALYTVGPTIQYHNNCVSAGVILNIRPRSTAVFVLYHGVPLIVCVIGT